MKQEKLQFTEMSVLRILGIDTSGKVASAAIIDDEKILCEKVLYTKLTHSQIILPMVKEVMADSEVDFEDIDQIAISNGPGSYTGLRIGIGAVKGICMGAPHIKCAGISTLLAVAYNCASFVGKIIVVMKARPKVVYVGEFSSDGEKINRISDDIVCDEQEFFEHLDTSQKTMLTGDYCNQIKSDYFSDNENILCANLTCQNQKASSLCMALMNNQQFITTPELLEAQYLQATKAEKLKSGNDN